MASKLIALTVFLGFVLSTTWAFNVLREGEQLPMEELKSSNYFKLIDMALKSGESATVELVDSEQMLIAQHGSRIILDCSPLMVDAGRPLSPNMEWKEIRLATGSDGVLVKEDRPKFFTTSPDRISITGELGRYLNITSANIVSREEVEDNGIYTCTVCAASRCKSASVTIFILGTLFELEKGKENGKFILFLHGPYP